MSETGIEWATDTWNPTTGCDQISPGCDNCYALARAARLRAAGIASYQTDGDPRTSGPGFGLALQPQRLDDPLRKRRPRVYFVNSMSDLFHKDVPVEFLAEIFAVMLLADQHVFQVLTKRPKRMGHLLATESPTGIRFWRALREALDRREPGRFRDFKGIPWPFENVWLGTSVETNRYAFRVDQLRDVPAVVRFVSAEPLLGPLDRVSWKGIDWVIFGGESGPRARPMEPEWVEDAIPGVWHAGGKVFVKQLGTALSARYGLGRGKGSDIDRWPVGLRHTLSHREMPVEGIPATV